MLIRRPFPNEAIRAISSKMEFLQAAPEPDVLIKGHRV
jgi:hypothetical protein